MTATAEAERLEADVGRKKPPEPEEVEYGTLVRMANDVAETARKLAPMEGVSMGKLISDIVRPVLAKMYAERLRQELKRNPGSK